MYKIFISYHFEEQELVNKIRIILNNAFEEKISFFLSSEMILPGEDWKDILKKALNNNDAIITIVTPKYLKKHWISIEWSAFWLKDKPAYLLRTNDVLVSDLPEPMRDRISAELFQIEDIKKLFKKISQDINLEKIPFEFAFNLAKESEMIYTKLLESEISNTYDIYKKNISILPDDSDKIMPVFWHFYNKNDHDTAIQIFLKVPSQTSQSKLLIELVDKGDYSFPESLLDKIPANKTNLTSFFKKLVDSAEPNDGLINKLIKHVYDSGVVMRKFAFVLIELKLYDKPIMERLIKSFHRMAEMQGVGRFLIDMNLHNEVCMTWIIERFTFMQSTDFAGLLRYAINQKTYTDLNFDFIKKVGILAEYAKVSTKKLLIYLANSGDIELTNRILDRNYLDEKMTLEVKNHIEGLSLLDKDGLNENEDEEKE